MTIIQHEGALSYVNEEENIVEMYPEIKTDISMFNSDKAADAKIVGSKLENVKSIINTKVKTLESKLNSFETIKSDIVSSALGTALSMSTDDSWDDIIGAISGVTNKGAWTGSISTSGGSVTIPKGYHDGSGKVTGPTLANLIGTNVTLASAADLLVGYTAYGKNGVKYTGTNKGYDAGYEDNNRYFNKRYSSTFTIQSNITGINFDIGFKPLIIVIFSPGWGLSDSHYIYINLPSFTISYGRNNSNKIVTDKISIKYDDTVFFSTYNASYASSAEYIIIAYGK